MSDGEQGPSDTEFGESEFYNGSEVDQDQVDRDLDNGAEDSSEDDSDESDDSDTDDSPDLDAAQDDLSPSSAQQSSTVDEVPGISPLALISLKAGLPSWKAEKGNKKKQVWRGLLKELRSLPENVLLTEAQLDMRGQVRGKDLVLVSNF